MNAGFNPQILAQKLVRLNNSRQSIETVSHWCVFHYRHCRQVVETWDSEFHSAPRERRVSLLYLANDIVQNSKKDSGRYVNEFWRVIPAALNDVFVNGDDFGRNVVQRLVDIWEERNIFGSHGQSLKEDYSRRFKELKSKSRRPSGESLERVISCYKHIVNTRVDEDTLMRKCQVSLSFVDNINNEYENEAILESSNGSGFVEELQEQHSMLRDIIEQFKTSELLRGNLVSYLKEALHEQEFKMEQVRRYIKEAQSRYKKADDLCQKLGIHVARQEPPNHGNSDPSEMAVSFAPDSANASSSEKGQSSAVMYSQENGGEHEVLNGILPSRPTRDDIEQKIEERSANKRQKLHNDVYAPQPQSPPPPPPPPPPSDAFQQPPPPPEHPPPPESTTSPPPPPTSDPPPVPPPPPTTDVFMSLPAAPFAGLPVPAGPMTAMPYSAYPVFPPLNYPMVNMPPPFPGAPNPPPGFQGLGGQFYGPPFPAPPPPPMNRK